MRIIVIAKKTQKTKLNILPKILGFEGNSIVSLFIITNPTPKKSRKAKPKNKYNFIITYLLNHLYVSRLYIICNRIYMKNRKNSFSYSKSSSFL
jgi:hypothetical protein